MKIGVVGTFVRDRIYPWQGEPADSIGGIYFTVSYLANLADSGTEIYPVCNLGEDLYRQVTKELAVYQNIRFDGFYKHPQTNTQVTLTYTSPFEREEVTTALMPSVNAHRLGLLSDADAIIINLITGDDVALDALQRLRAKSDALFYLDFHTRCLAIDEHGKRFYHRPDDWQEWVRCVDVLQLNEKEAETLAGNSQPLDDAELQSFAEQILTLGPSICNITLAEKGSMLAFKQNGRPQVHVIPSVPVPDILDMIGCGDAFEAAFVLYRLQGRSEIESAQYANLVAAINTTFVGSSGIRNIQKKIDSFELK